MNEQTKSPSSRLSFITFGNPGVFSSSNSDNRFQTVLESYRPMNESTMRHVMAAVSSEKPHERIDGYKHLDDACFHFEDSFSRPGYGGVQRIIDIVLQGLQDPVSEVRASAASVIKKSISQEFLVPLLALTNDDDERVRGSAYKAIGSVGRDSVVSLLAEAASVEKDEKVRYNIVVGLGSTQSRAATPALMGILHDEISPSYVKAEAVCSLGVSADPNDPYVRREVLAAKVLSQWASKCSAGAIAKLDERGKRERLKSAPALAPAPRSGAFS